MEGSVDTEGRFRDALCRNKGQASAEPDGKRESDRR